MPIYETRELKGGGTYLIKCMAEGFKQCRVCGHLIKFDGNRCPVCRHKFSWKLGSCSIQETMNKIAEYKKSSQVKRFCSRCASDKTYVNKGKYYDSPRWQRDGKGGWLCANCYEKVRDETVRAWSVDPVLP